jgi:hypothetical protein
MSVIEPVFFPGGVADPAGGAGYVADGGGIVAIGLRAGERLWRTDRAAEPLIAQEERLAAALPREHPRNVIEVVVLDAGRGEPTLVSDPVVLPDWVTADPRTHDRFRMTARIEDHRLQLEWEAHGRYSGGAPPPPEVRREAARDATGLLEVDLGTGVVSPLPVTGSEDAGPSVRRPPLDDDLTEPWLAGTETVRLVWEIDGVEQAVALETTEASRPGSRSVVEIARGQGLVAQVTLDGRYVCVHREPAASADDRWAVFSASTGERVASVPRDAGARSPAVLWGRVYYLVERAAERELRTRDLASGTLAWELPLAARPMRGPPRLRQ